MQPCSVMGIMITRLSEFGEDAGEHMIGAKSCFLAFACASRTYGATEDCESLV